MFSCGSWRAHFVEGHWSLAMGLAAGELDPGPQCKGLNNWNRVWGVPASVVQAPRPSGAKSPRGSYCHDAVFSASLLV